MESISCRNEVWLDLEGLIQSLPKEYLFFIEDNLNIIDKDWIKVYKSLNIKTIRYI